MNDRYLGESGIYSISKKIVEECLPEESGLFEDIWQILKKEISEREESVAELLTTQKYDKRLAKELQFLDEAEVSGLQTPKVIALISLVWLRLAELRGQLQDVEIIEKTITKYGESLPEWLRLETTRLAVRMIKEDLKEIGRFPVIEEEEEKKYVMYSHDNKKGEPITETQYTELKEIDKSTFLIWLDEKNNDLIITGNKADEAYPEERRALACLLKNIGKLVSYEDLYKAIHNIQRINEKEMENWKFEFTSDVYKCISSLRRHCSEIKRFIDNKRGEGYKLELPKSIRYCLLTELPGKNT